MNLVQMLCCVLVARAGELGQNYLVDKVNGLRGRRLVNNDAAQNSRLQATAADANRFIDSAITEMTISGADLCKCEVATAPTTQATDRRLRWQDYMRRLKH